MSGTNRYEGQVCPNDNCHIDQRFRGFRGFCCPECACRLVVACTECDSGAVERFDGSPVCTDHAPDLAADGGWQATGTEQKPVGSQYKIFCKGCGIHLSWTWADEDVDRCGNCGGPSVDTGNDQQ